MTDIFLLSSQKYPSKLMKQIYSGSNLNGSEFKVTHKLYQHEI